MGTTTVIYKGNFRLNGTLLEQEVEVIQHLATDERDVGVYHEWHQVTIGGNQVNLNRPIDFSGMERDMIREAREVAGFGYTRDYYQQIASGFLTIVKCHLNQP